ncbi:hypothetical protein ABZP36_030058 [Zizania latifolia]
MRLSPAVRCGCGSIPGEASGGAKQSTQERNHPCHGYKAGKRDGERFTRHAQERDERSGVMGRACRCHRAHSSSSSSAAAAAFLLRGRLFAATS